MKTYEIIPNAEKWIVAIYDRFGDLITYSKRLPTSELAEMWGKVKTGE